MTISRNFNVAGLILARGGSKSIPRKNLKQLAGKALIGWAIKPMLKCKRFSSVWISTEDQEIADVAKTFGIVNIHERPFELATDNASSWSCVNQFVNEHPEFTHICLVQCTSPYLLVEYLDKGLDILLDGNHDSVFSAKREHKLRWTITKDNYVEPLNFDPANRPRRQDWSGELIESGHFYMCSCEVVKSGLLQGKRCGYVEIPAEMCFEIDNASDWIVAENLIKTNTT